MNKKVPLRLKGTWKHRLAATFGITVTDLKLEDETRYENLLGGRSSLLFGLGYRLTRSIRVGGGALLFLKNDPNPLVTDRSGRRCILRAFDDSTGNLFGFFSGVTPSDELGMVVAQFTPGNTIERGEATIRARVMGTGVSAQVKIEIIDP